MIKRLCECEIRDTRIKRLHVLRDIKYQPVQTGHGSFGEDVVMLLCLSLILCLIAIIVLDLRPSVYALVKVQKDIAAGNVTSLLKKGLALDKSGNHTEAIEYYNKVLAIDPNDVATLDAKGVSLDYLGNYTGAIEYYDRALAIDPNDVYALTNKGIALDALRNLV